MSVENEPAARELTGPEIAEILRRILNAVEKDKRQRWVDVTCAIVLSLATMATAWCAYQSTLWGGVQTFRLAAAGKAGREASENTVAAVQFRAFDASMFIDYVRAVTQADKQLQEFLYNRFRPEMRTAIDAWLETDPLHNPKAPPHPFRMAEYVQSEAQEARRQEEEAGKMLAGAQEANETSDRYVLLTVLFASVLFFNGISATLDSRGLRVALVSSALFIFIATMVFLGTMPVCSE